MSDKSILKRLAFIKYLYKIGIEQSYKPEPLCSSSILLFHDSVELFLSLSCENFNIGTDNIKFMEYWEKLSKKLPEGFPTQKESMRRFNKSRVALKHNGTMPSKIDIEAFRATITNFFEENTREIHKIDFSKISLIDIVQSKEAKQSLQKSISLIDSKNYKKSVECSAMAFTQMVYEYENHKDSYSYYSPFFFGKHLWLHEGEIPEFSESGSFKRFIVDLKDTVEELQNALKIISLGIDYKRYIKFHSLIPYIVTTGGGTHNVSWGFNEKNINRTIENAEFCIDFVIESAIILADFDYNN